MKRDNFATVKPWYDLKIYGAGTWITAKPSLLAKFSDATTIHGIRYFLSPDHHWFIRFLWLLVSLTGLYLCYRTIQPQYQSYIEGDVRTTQVLTTPDAITFPALTFCSLNFFRRSVVAANATNLMRGMMLNNWTMDLIKVVCPPEERPNNEYLKTFNPFTTVFQDVGLAMHDAFQSVISCIFKNTACNDNIVNVMTDRGLCFTFNPGGHLRSPDDMRGMLLPNLSVWYPNVVGFPANTSASGYNTGLNIVLNAQHFESCDTGGVYSQAVGFQIAIHDPATDAWFSLQPHVSVKPGTRTEIVVRMKRVLRRTENLNRCLSHLQLDYYEDRKYRQQSCYVECIVKLANATCGCVPPSAPVGALWVLLGSMRKASDFTLTKFMCIEPNDTKCYLKKKEEMLAQTLHKICPRCKTACEEAMYVIDQVSTQLFPSDNAASLFFDKKYPNLSASSAWKFLEKDTNFMDLRKKYEMYFKGNGSFKSAEEVRNNILAVRVYFGTMLTETIEEDPLVSRGDLVSQLGGATGLFLGASLLSFFELIYWCALAIFTRCFRK